MAIYNTNNTYGSVNKFFHWLVFILVFIMICLGFLLGHLPKSIRGTAYDLHKLTGLTILIVMLLRLFWKWMNPKPALPRQTRLWERIAEHSVHNLWYVVLIGMPLAGWFMSSAAGRYPSFFGLFSIPAPFIPVNKALAGTFSDIHSFLAYSIIVLFCIHVVAALKHYFIDKDDILQRMMPGGN